MPDKKFDPKKFIDREFEQELFENLLQFKDDARILAIEDGGGMGKSQLLQKLQYRCRTVKPRTPVSLIALDQLSDNNPFTLINAIVEDLDAFENLQFPEFKKYDAARTSGDFSLMLSSVYLQGANFQGASSTRIASTMQNIERAENVTLQSTGGGALTPEQQAKAQEVCIAAFFGDLKQQCTKTPVVLMFDAYEKCEDRLKRWIENYLLEKHFFDLNNRPTQLLLVVAGRELPDFETKWAEDDIEAVVGSVRQLRKWKKKHVEECLRAHGINYKPEQVDVFYGLIQMGCTPLDVVQLIETRLSGGAS